MSSWKPCKSQLQYLFKGTLYCSLSHVSVRTLLSGEFQHLKNSVCFTLGEPLCVFPPFGRSSGIQQTPNQLSLYSHASEGDDAGLRFQVSWCLITLNSLLWEKKKVRFFGISQGANFFQRKYWESMFLPEEIFTLPLLQLIQPDMSIRRGSIWSRSKKGVTGEPYLYRWVVPMWMLNVLDFLQEACRLHQLKNPHPLRR